jgi:hypothetical protein
VVTFPDRVLCEIFPAGATGVLPCDESEIQLQLWTTTPPLAHEDDGGESEHALLRKEVSRLVQKMHRDFRPEHHAFVASSSQRRDAETRDDMPRIDAWRGRKAHKNEPLHIHARRLGIPLMRAIFCASICYMYDFQRVPSLLLRI